MSYLDHINRMVERFVQEHDDIRLCTYGEDLTDTVRLKMYAENGSVERKISHKTLLTPSGYFAVTKALYEMHKELTDVT